MRSRTEMKKFTRGTQKKEGIAKLKTDQEK